MLVGGRNGNKRRCSWSKTSSSDKHEELDSSTTRITDKIESDTPTTVVGATLKSDANVCAESVRAVVDSVSADPNGEGDAQQRG